MSTTTQGAKANKNGHVLEGTILPVLIANGFEIIDLTKWRKMLQGKIATPPRVAIKNMPYKSIYGHHGKTEFVLVSETGARATTAFPNAQPGVRFECRIECKSQQSQGSTDEKLPYLVMNAETCYPENNVILLLEMEGAKPGALIWLNNALSERTYQTNPDKIIVQQNIVEFLRWAGKAFG